MNFSPARLFAMDMNSEHVPCPNYEIDAYKSRNQAPGASGESLSLCEAWRCPDGTQFLDYWQNQAFLSDGFLQTVQLLIVQFSAKSFAIEDQFILDNSQSLMCNGITE